MLSVIEFFFLSLALGVGIFTPIASTRLTGAGLLKLLTTVSMVSLIVGIAVHIAAEFHLWQTVTMGISLISMALVYTFHRDEKTLLMWTLYLVQNASLIFAAFHFSEGSLHETLYLLSSSLLQGIVTYSMLLGHWYLVTPKISVSPLVKAHLLLWGIIGVKIIWAGMNSSQIYGTHFVPGTLEGAGYLFNWVFVSMRGLWGYGIIILMSLFSWRLVRMRSTQSATGVLYAMTFFILVGELIATYLNIEYGVSL